MKKSNLTLHYTLRGLMCRCKQCNNAVKPQRLSNCSSNEHVEACDYEIAIDQTGSATRKLTAVTILSEDRNVIVKSAVSNDSGRNDSGMGSRVELLRSECL